MGSPVRRFNDGLGQSRHFDLALITSGIPRLTDILRVSRHVSKVAEGEYAPKKSHD
jgi:hypothetical protein